ncbi:ATP-binding protein [Streptomyces sp. CA-253872]|uniref:ATP-binding protein n=1 Tax=Streptomyces sp. CA-253872 TaxID=3240067 RepID=UPI003D91C87F
MASTSRGGRTYVSTPTPTGPPGYIEMLERTAESVDRAEALARHTVRVWSLDPLADRVALVMRELAGNAVRFGTRGAICVAVRRVEPRVVRVEVTDHARTLPVLAPAPSGLRRLEEVAEKWGTTPRRWGGKTVWADICE